MLTLRCNRWLVAGGSACIFFCTLGFANSFGTFQEYYMTHQLQAESASKISWIGSLMSFLQFFSGMVGGPLFDRFGAKVCFHSVTTAVSAEQIY
jgi:MFS family permease